MNRLILFFLIITFSSLKIDAQYRDYFKTIGQFSLMMTHTGYGAQADLLKKSRGGFYNRYSVSYDMGAVGNADTKYQTLKADFVILSTISSREQKYVNIGCGAFISQERLSNNLLNMKDTQISPGITAMLEFEIFLKYWGFYIIGEQRYRPISIIGDLEWRAGIGVKYLIK